METVLITGYSKAPQGTSMYENFKYSGIVLEVNKYNHIVVNVEFTFVTALAQDYFRRLIIGTDLSAEIDHVIQKIRLNYLAPSQQSVIVALKVAHQRYWDDVREKNSFSVDE